MSRLNSIWQTCKGGASAWNRSWPSSSRSWLRSPRQDLRREADALERTCDEDERAVAEFDARLRETRAERERLDADLDLLRQQLHEASARLQSLKELQAAAAEEDDAHLVDWLRERQLDSLPRLAARLTVEPGWERAVERVLGSDLVALCVPSFREYAPDAQTLNPPHLAFIETGPAGGPAGAADTLLAKLHSDIDLAPRLAGIRVADTLDTALARRASLADNESIVTRDGAWVGRNWLSLSHDRGKRSGWLAREREIEKLVAEVAGARTRADDMRARLSDTQERLASLERGRDALSQGLNDRHRLRAQLREQLGHQQARFAQLSARRDQIRHELGEIIDRLTRDRSAIDEAGQLLLSLDTGAASLGERRNTLTRERGESQGALEQASVHENAMRDALHRLQVERQGLQTAHDSIRGSLARLEGQLQQLLARREELARVLTLENMPEAELAAKLDECLARRLEVEGRLNAAREAVTQLDGHLREQEQSRHAHERRVQQVRETMEAERVARETLRVRRDTQAAQVSEAGNDLAQVLAEMPVDAGEYGLAGASGEGR